MPFKKNMFIVYILYSGITFNYYTGQTDNHENRLKRHNSGLSSTNIWKELENNLPYCIFNSLKINEFRKKN